MLGALGLATGCAGERWSDTHVEAPGHAKSWDDEARVPRDEVAFATATANEVMMREHGLFERLLLVYEEAAVRLGGERPIALVFDGEPGFVTVGGVISAAARMIRRVAEDGHFAIEEKLIFSRLRKDGIEPSLIDELSKQHRQARALTNALSAYVEKNGAREGDAELVAMLGAYARLSRAHASREETLVYPAARVTQSEQAYAKLSDELARASTFNQDSWARTESELVAMEMALGIHDMRPYAPAMSRPRREI